MSTDDKLVNVTTQGEQAIAVALRTIAKCASEARKLGSIAIAEELERALDFLAAEHVERQNRRGGGE